MHGTTIGGEFLEEPLSKPSLFMAGVCHHGLASKQKQIDDGKVMDDVGCVPPHHHQLRYLHSINILG